MGQASCTCHLLIILKFSRMKSKFTRQKLWLLGQVPNKLHMKLYPLLSLFLHFFCMQFAFSRKKSISPATKICEYLKILGMQTVDWGCKLDIGGATATSKQYEVSPLTGTAACPCAAASQARRSAASLPSSPAWPGTHWRVLSMPWSASACSSSHTAAARAMVCPAATRLRSCRPDLE